MTIQRVPLSGLRFYDYLAQQGQVPIASAGWQPGAPVGGVGLAVADRLTVSTPAPPRTPAPTSPSWLSRLQQWWPSALNPARWFGSTAQTLTAAGRMTVHHVGQGLHLVGSLPSSKRPDRGEDRQAKSAYEAMKAAAARAGISLSVSSNYRGYAHQLRLWLASDRSGRWVAAPGHSEHQTGLAFDLGTRGYSAGSRGNFGSSPAYRWLTENASRFGFVQSMSWEPWHWRFDPLAVQAAGGQLVV